MNVWVLQFLVIDGESGEMIPIIAGLYDSQAARDDAEKRWIKENAAAIEARGGSYTTQSTRVLINDDLWES